ncbi:MAG: EAL domain-containing protein [Pseudomonas sp.]
MRDPNTLRLLLIEDDEDDFLITRELLGDVPGLVFILDWVSTLREGKELALLGEHDVVLVDYRLGADSGLMLIDELRSQGLQTPMILLTGAGDSELDARAIKLGAADYLVKGEFSGAMLTRSLRYARDRAFITARLVESENRYRRLLEDNQAPLLVVDSDNQVHFVNPAAQELFNHALHTSPIELPATGLALFETQVTLTNGEVVELEVQRSTTEWEGQPMELLSLRDITQRKRLDEQLRLLQRGMEVSVNGIIVVDAIKPDMPIIYANKAVEIMTGYPVEQIIGINCRFLQADDRNQPEIAELRAAITDKRDTRVVLRNYRRDGSMFWNEVYITPVPNEAGEITHFIGVQNDISEQKRYEEDLAHNASHDRLTGLANRHIFEDRLLQTFKLSLRNDWRIAVLFVDLDGFKPINDSLGHLVGDQVLIQIARRLELAIRPGDTVARMGSDEFIVLLPDLRNEEDVLGVAHRILEAVARPLDVNEISLRLTASIGITLSDDNLSDPQQLIQQADLAMYKAKQQGRNNYQWYTRNLNQQVHERLAMRGELQRAIELEQFEVYYQPQVSARSGQVCGYEALLRWNHPERGMIAPDVFIPIAESTGQIIPLSEWVLRQACSDAMRLGEFNLENARVAVNLSSLHFQRSNFIVFIQSLLKELGMPPQLLELEVTESLLLDNIDQAIETLQALKDYGITIAIDDFGTGFSSLSYLKRLPIDKVKIDRTFVAEVISDSRDAAIVQSVISMAHNLSLVVIAEGVETEAQQAFLRKYNCDEFQGYFYAKPMPFDGFVGWLREHVESRVLSEESPADQPTLLLLDDEENILRALVRLLRRDGYRILSATSANQAFELLAQNQVQVIISDQRMPEMTGTEFLSRVKDIYPDTIRMVLSGYTDLKSVTEAINRGAIYKFMTKPWDDVELRETVSMAFRKHASNAETD